LKEKKSDFYVRIRQVGILTSVPFLLAGGPVMGYFIGDWIDGKFGCDPYGKAVLMLLGLAGAGREVFRMIREILKEVQE